MAAARAEYYQSSGTNVKKNCGRKLFKFEGISTDYLL